MTQRSLHNQVQAVVNQVALKAGRARDYLDTAKRVLDAETGLRPELREQYDHWLSLARTELDAIID